MEAIDCKKKSGKKISINACKFKDGSWKKESSTDDVLTGIALLFLIVGIGVFVYYDKHKGDQKYENLEQEEKNEKKEDENQ